MSTEQRPVGAGAGQESVLARQSGGRRRQLARSGRRRRDPKTEHERRSIAMEAKPLANTVDNLEYMRRNDVG